MKKGRPPALPMQWRNKLPSDMVMSFTPPEVTDGYTLVILQASPQLPAFGRYCIPLPGDIRENRVADNPMGHEHLWPQSLIRIGHHVRRSACFNRVWPPVI